MFHKQIEFYYETWYMTFTIRVDVYGSNHALSLLSQFITRF